MVEIILFLLCLLRLILVKYGKKNPVMLGQPKINGLRCLITASRNNDMFKPYNLKFQSREGVVWNTLGNLEDYLLSVLPASFVQYD